MLGTSRELRHRQENDQRLTITGKLGVAGAVQGALRAFTGSTALQREAGSVTWITGRSCKNPTPNRSLDLCLVWDSNAEPTTLQRFLLERGERIFVPYWNRCKVDDQTYVMEQFDVYW